MDKPKMTQKDLDACLFEACQTSNLNYARLALASGANVNAKDNVGNTPLHFATARSNEELTATYIDRGELVAALVDCGADMNAANNAGRTPLHYATQQGYAGRVTEERKDKGPPQVGG